MASGAKLHPSPPTAEENTNANAPSDVANLDDLKAFNDDDYGGSLGSSAAQSQLRAWSRPP